MVTEVLGYFPELTRKLSERDISKPSGGTSGSTLAADANHATLLNCSVGVWFGLGAKPGTGKCILPQRHQVQCQTHRMYILQVTISNGFLAVASFCLLTKSSPAQDGSPFCLFFFSFFVPFCYVFFFSFHSCTAHKVDWEAPDNNAETGIYGCGPHTKPSNRCCINRRCNKRTADTPV